MNNEVDYLSQCAGKNSYTTYDEAMRSYRGKRKHAPTKAYKCCFCGKYHCGNSTGKTTKKERQQCR